MTDNVSVTSQPTVQTATLREKIVQRSPWTDALRRFRRNRLAMLGVVFLVLMLLTAILADVITPYPFDYVNLNLQARMLPFVDPTHILGLDASSRDYLARLIYGARTSMLVGLSVPMLSFAIGVPLGALSGFIGGKVDFTIQRLVDVATAIPPLVFALFLLSVLGSGVGNVIMVLAITGWVESTRLTRAQFLTYREKEFVTSARALGASNWQIITSHILPNAISPLLIAFTFAVPLAIFAEAGLSFLGIGITEPTASWGKMIGGGIGNTIRVYYHLALFPTLLVALTMLSFSFVGDGLQEALDPNRSQ
ncbi:MAG: ABC transporter permease [Chloroflexi bacterium]|nr:ABC transporter permease [Chloroflexota bacterium]MCC6892745.1 ABC transporter permease [Anaerolineae bacterium]